MKRSTRSLAIFVLTFSLGACSKDSDQGEKTAKSPDWERGRAVFVANCVACHSTDPSRWRIGPAIKGSSKELLEARVLTPAIRRATNLSARPR